MRQVIDERTSSLIAAQTKPVASHYLRVARVRAGGNSRCLSLREHDVAKSFPPVSMP